MRSSSAGCASTSGPGPQKHSLHQGRSLCSRNLLSSTSFHWRAAQSRQQHRHDTQALLTGDSGEGDSLDEARQQLSRLFEAPTITGQELRDLIFDKWGRSYDVRLHKRGRRIYLQVMWKFLEQRSFHLSEGEYQAQLDAVAEYLTIWRAGETARAGIRSAAAKGPGYTGGGGARAVSIPLDVDVEGGRSGEWDSF